MAGKQDRIQVNVLLNEHEQFLLKSASVAQDVTVSELARRGILAEARRVIWPQSEEHS